MAGIEAHPGMVKVLFQDGASSSSELFKEDTAVSEILEHLGCQGGALKRADGLKYIGSNVVPAGVYQLVRPAPPPGGVVGTSISLTDLLKSRYNTWIVNTKSDSSHQRKYPGLQLGIWNLDKDEVAAYLGDKLGTKTMAASEDPRFKGSSSVWGTWWRQSCNRRGWASTLQWIQQQLLTLGSQTLWWVKASVHADYWWLVKGRPLE